MENHFDQMTVVSILSEPCAGEDLVSQYDYSSHRVGPVAPCASRRSAWMTPVEPSGRSNARAALQPCRQRSDSAVLT